MLLDFSLRNFFSFREGASISFRLDANCPDYISQGLPFTPVLCVKGANGSGKTHLLKGLAFLIQFCSRSFNADPDDLIPVSPFFDSPDPCDFSAVFVNNGTCYTYELVVTKHKIIRETLYRTKSKKSKILERKENAITFKTKDFAKLESMKLRPNVSIISTARQYDMLELVDVYGFFESSFSNVTHRGLNERPISISAVSEILNRNEAVFDFVKFFITTCDTGISDIEISSTEDEEGKTIFFPKFIHKKGGEEHVVTDISESSGTKALYRNLGLYKAVLGTGGVLVLDEFDINLHPHILPKLINLFLDRDINVEQAQLIFTTHNSEVMDILGRYRTCLVNKEDNESYTYRLDELPGNILRNDRPISPAYNGGKIGGIPRL